MISKGIWWHTHKESMEIKKFGKRAEITPQLYSQGMKHFVTRLHDKCWFSKKPHINELTVEDALVKYPDYMLWCRTNLHVRWSCKVERIFYKMLEDNKNHPLVIAYYAKLEKEYEKYESMYT